MEELPVETSAEITAGIEEGESDATGETMEEELKETVTSEEAREAA